MKRPIHQYIDRKTSKVRTERLFSDQIINLLYSGIRENAPFLFGKLTSNRTSSLLGFLNYDLIPRIYRPLRIFKDLGINPDEIWGNPEALTTYRKIFERKIRYWKCRPMDETLFSVVSPADAKVLTGSFPIEKDLFIKEKFFSFPELIARHKTQWLKAFAKGDYAVFRLTPDKYHYNHTPVSGKVVDTYEINGNYNSCNPGAVVQSVTPFSKNRRILTIIDTNVANGTHVGLVAMVEIVALMIGRINQCYCPERYDSPITLEKGDFIQKGQPKSLFAPGSSTTVLIFQKNRIQFSQDLLENQNRSDASSRFTKGFGMPLVETDLMVRETIGEAI